MIITSDQATTIIESANRLVIDGNSKQKVYFAEINNDGDLALFYYNEANDDPVLLALKSELDKCTWHLDRHYIEADLGEKRVWNGYVYIKAANEADALV